MILDRVRRNAPASEFVWVTTTDIHPTAPEKWGYADAELRDRVRWWNALTACKGEVLCFSNRTRKSRFTFIPYFGGRFTNQSDRPISTTQ